MGHAGRKRAFSRAAPPLMPLNPGGTDHALRNGGIDAAFVFDLEPRFDNVC
jgi:hypothetical protein